MVCPRCGFENYPNALYCAYCKAPLQSAPPPVPLRADPPPPRNHLSLAGAVIAGVLMIGAALVWLGMDTFRKNSVSSHLDFDDTSAIEFLIDACLIAVGILIIVLGRRNLLPGALTYLAFIGLNVWWLLAQQPIYTAPGHGWTAIYLIEGLLIFIVGVPLLAVALAKSPAVTRVLKLMLIIAAGLGILGSLVLAGMAGSFEVEAFILDEIGVYLEIANYTSGCAVLFGAILAIAITLRPAQLPHLARVVER